MLNFVRVEDVAARWRPLSEDEQTVTQTLLGDAWALLLTVVPTLPSRYSSGQVSDALLVSIVSAMVLRVMRNPEGIRQWSIDDASFTRDNALSTGGLYVSPDELALLTGAASRRGGAFSAAPAPAAPVRARGSEWPYW